MEELILKMHEEAMELKQTVTELKCIIDSIEDAIEKEEIETAENTWNNRDDVKKVKIRASDIKKLIGMNPAICYKADSILKEREEEKQKAIKEEIKNEE